MFFSWVQLSRLEELEVSSLSYSTRDLDGLEFNNFLREVSIFLSNISEGIGSSTLLPVYGQTEDSDSSYGGTN